MKVIVITTVKNRKELTKVFLRAIKKQTYKDIQTIVVDDGSDDGTSDMIGEDFPDVTVLKGDGNLWWTGSMRIAINHILPKVAKGDFILCQNNDTDFSEDFVKDLVELSNENGRCIVGTVAKNVKDESVIYNAHKYTNYALCPVVVEFTDKEKEDGISFNTDTLNTRGTLVPIEVFDVLKNFSKYFPHYAADYDFFCRAVKRGFRVGTATNIITYVTQSSPGLAQRIKGKKKNSLKDFKELFFFRRSSNNLYSTTLFTLLHNKGLGKVIGILKIYAYVLKFIFVNMIVNNIRYWRAHE